MASSIPTRGLHSFTSQLNLSSLVTTRHIPLSNRLGKIMHPTYPTKRACVEPKSGRV